MKFIWPTHSYIVGKLSITYHKRLHEKELNTVVDVVVVVVDVVVVVVDIVV